jgi:hypothetical protein
MLPNTSSAAATCMYPSSPSAAGPYLRGLSAASAAATGLSPHSRRRKRKTMQQPKSKEDLAILPLGKL